LSRSVPFFNYPAQFTRHQDALLATIESVLAAGKYILQEDLDRFERNLAAYLGTSHAIGVGSGTDALLLALRACGIGNGDEVILPSHTFVATAAAVHHAGAAPVLVDVRDDHLIDPDAVEAALTPRTRAILPVHLNGRCADMDRLASIAEASGLLIIEDAAQGLGACYNGKKAGTFGRAAGFSFYPAKLLGCFGDGGAVATADEEVAGRLRSLRDHGRSSGLEVTGWSYNSRLDNLQAAVLDLKLAAFEDEIQKRRDLAGLYHRRLAGVGDLLLPPAPDRPGPHFDVYQNYEIEAHDRDALKEHLAARGVGTIIQWGGRAIHQFPALGLAADLPVTDRVMAESLLLPMHTALETEDVHYVCDQVESFYNR
jgi:dTDP-4-amino-4,6-dideoxygalactose transaminase